jgi:chromate transporter
LINTPDSPQYTRLLEVAALFLKLGIIGFGGPAAHIAMMREEVVRRSKWVTDKQFFLPLTFWCSAPH